MWLCATGQSCELCTGTCGPCRAERRLEQLITAGLPILLPGNVFMPIRSSLDVQSQCLAGLAGGVSACGGGVGTG